MLVCDGIAIEASLLPSLRASYYTKELKGEGHTGIDAAFLFSLPGHVLQLTTTVCFLLVFQTLKTYFLCVCQHLTNFNLLLLTL